MEYYGHGKSLNLFTNCEELCHVIHIIYLDRNKLEKASVPPYFLHHIDDTACDYGQLAKLHCDVTGQPEPDIFWFKEDSHEPLCEYSGKYAVVKNCGHVMLMIQDVTTDDIGYYTCKVSNPFGDASSTGRLFFSPSKVGRKESTNAQLKEIILEETLNTALKKPADVSSLLPHVTEDTMAITFALSSNHRSKSSSETGTLPHGYTAETYNRQKQNKLLRKPFKDQQKTTDHRRNFKEIKHKKDERKIPNNPGQDLKRKFYNLADHNACTMNEIDYEQANAYSTLESGLSTATLTSSTNQSYQSTSSSINSSVFDIDSDYGAEKVDSSACSISNPQAKPNKSLQKMHSVDFDERGSFYETTKVPLIRSHSLGFQFDNLNTESETISESINKESETDNPNNVSIKHSEEKNALTCSNDDNSRTDNSFDVEGPVRPSQEETVWIEGYQEFQDAYNELMGEFEKASQFVSKGESKVTDFKNSENFKTFSHFETELNKQDEEDAPNTTSSNPTQGEAQLQRSDVITTLLDLSKTTNVFVATLKIEKQKRHAKSDYIAFVTTSPPLKVSFDSRQQEDTDYKEELKSFRSDVKRRKPEFIIPLKNTTLFHKDVFNVVISGCPELTVTWLYNDKHLDDSKNGSLYQFQELGTIMCLAQNAEGSATSCAKLTCPTSLPLDDQATTDLTNKDNSDKKRFGVGFPPEHTLEEDSCEKNKVNVMEHCADNTYSVNNPPNSCDDRRFSILSFSSMSSALYFSAEDDPAGLSETTIDYFSPLEDDLHHSTEGFFIPNSKQNLTSRCSHAGTAAHQDDELFIPRPSGIEHDTAGSFVESYFEVEGNIPQFQITAFNTLQSAGADEEYTDSGGKTPVPQPLIKVDVFPPAFQKELCDVTAQAGASVTLHCLVMGFPTPQVFWYKNGISILGSTEEELCNRGKINKNSEMKDSQKALHISRSCLEEGKYQFRLSLTISPIDKEDQGEYTAAVSNIYGTIASTALLIVKEDRHTYQCNYVIDNTHAHMQENMEPYFDAIMEDISTSLNSAVTFTVALHGKPSPSVTWYKDSVILSDENCKRVNDGCRHSLVINNVTFSDGGIYACKGENIAGEVICKAELSVKNDSHWTCSSDDDICSQIPARRFKDFYSVIKLIGQGDKPQIKSAVSVVSGETYAAKYWRNSLKDKRMAKNEMSILSKLHHENIATFKEAFYTNKHVIMITEACEEEMFDCFVSCGTLTERMVASFCRQLCQALSYLHERNIVHLGLTPESLLVANGQLKLTNFERSLQMNTEDLAFCEWGIPDFVAPEIVLSEEITPATDIWSVGVITYIALTGVSPFSGDTDYETLANVVQRNCTFSLIHSLPHSDVILDFVDKLIVLHQKSRMPSKSLLYHPWLNIEERDNTIVMPTEKLKLFQSKRLWQRSLVCGNSSLTNQSISSLYKHEYDSLSLAVSRQLVKDISSSLSDTDTDVSEEVIKCFTTAGNVETEPSEAPKVEVQTATPPQSPASARRETFAHSRTLSGSMERPLLLDDQVKRSKGPVFSRSLDELNSNVNFPHTGPIQSRRRCLKLDSIGKKVSFEDEILSYDATMFSSIANESSQATISSIKENCLEQIEQKGQDLKLESHIPSSTLRHHPQISQSSSDEHESDGERKSLSRKIRKQRQNLKSTSNNLPFSAVRRKPRKGILKKGPLMESDQGFREQTEVFKEEKFLKIPGHRKRRRFAKSPSLDMRPCDDEILTSTASARRRFQMQRGLSADSALVSSKQKQSGLRGPLQEHRSQPDTEELQATAGDFMRTSSLLHEGSSRKGHTALTKTMLSSLQRPLQKLNDVQQMHSTDNLIMRSSPDTGKKLGIEM